MKQLSKLSLLTICRLSTMTVPTWLMEMCFFLLTNPQIMASYLDRSWNIIELVSVLLLTQGSVIQLTSHCGRCDNLFKLTSLCPLKPALPFFPGRRILQITSTQKIIHNICCFHAFPGNRIHNFYSFCKLYTFSYFYLI